MRNKRKIWICLFITVVVSAIGIGVLVANNMQNPPVKETTKKKEKSKKEESIATKYTELGKLQYNVDEAPIAINDEGYIIKVNGLYGFINVNQEIMLEPIYTNITRIGVEAKEDVCFAKDNYNTTVDVYGNNCRGGIGGTSNYGFAWDSNIDQSVVFTNGLPVGSNVIPVSEYTNQFEGSGVFVSDLIGYYFFNVFNETDIENLNVIDLTGKAYIVKDGIERVDSTMYDQVTILKPSLYNTYALLRVRPVSDVNALRKGDKWAIMDKNLNFISGFEYENLTPLSDVSTYIEKNGLKGILDGTGNLAYLGVFDEVTGMIDNKAFVKLNGEWIQIQIKK